MLTITDRLPAINSAVNAFTLVLTAEERTKSRHRFETEEGETVFLRLPRGTVLRDGDMLRSDNGEYLILVKAKSELVLTVTAATSLDLLRAAYHLGNRHVPLEIGTTYLRLSPDPVLQAMLEHLGVMVVEENAPFQPEVGAYGHH
ncbi:MAG: Urease accessory protein UreE [Chroococcidiopsis sp. SAG 2025]|uniref:urease accessory protein UreE n=1 Tax=Chroococcidiopsis sp. SAG 2025 TaxID=171389 RepID=UPI002937452C|nr:urease accessory protein UreE [Chroococcidiopsis sp. SAG 2025]MDV2996682.1 Urease accessory protein UreE [Chroococcidiopsis sp. SAG 2025]